MIRQITPIDMASPNGEMNCCKNPLNATSATPAPPGVGEIRRMTHITNCLA